MKGDGFNGEKGKNGKRGNIGSGNVQKRREKKMEVLEGWMERGKDKKFIIGGILTYGRANGGDGNGLRMDPNTRK